uniref:hypothetical protein n=1 Tax=uncultured Sphingomonas sp. TaxID=158754 RepID=UPI0035CA7C19
MLRSILLAPLAMFGATAALAQTPPPATSPVATKIAKPAKDKLVCEDEEQVGSRLGGHRVCKTAAQWADERQQNRMMLDRAQTQRTCTNGSGC